jgi:hypothetical protein
MARSRLGLEVLGLFALLLGVLGFAAMSAKAEVGAKWQIENKLGSFIDASVLSASLTTNGFEGGIGQLLTTILGTAVSFKCTAVALAGVKLEGEGRTTNGGKGQFTGCSTKLGGVETPECQPRTAGSALGTIETNATKGLIVLHKGETLVRVEPKSGTTLVTIETGEECPIGENVPISGTLTLVDSLFGLSTVTHFVTQGALTSLTALGKFASTDGTVLIKLSGEHAGRPWRGLPG